jgi:predicted GNAT family N-acyltransferase
MNVETLDRRSMNEPDARAVATLICAIWPKPGRTVESVSDELLTKHRDYAGPEEQYPRLFVIREAGRILACASAVPRSIDTVIGPITVVALARVCTDPQARGRGLGQAVVAATFDLVDRKAFPFSLFQTSPDVRPFYERFGCVSVDNRFINSLADNPAANPFWNPVIMRYPDTPGWPAGQIDLCGPGW